MKIIIAVLSDIHLTDQPTHPFSKRIDLIAAAVGSAESAPDAILTILSGDIADKGKTEQYDAMKALLSRYKNSLGSRIDSPVITVISCEG